MANLPVAQRTTPGSSQKSPGGCIRTLVRTKVSCRGQVGRLILQNLLDLADLLLHLAGDLLSSPLGLQPAIAGHDPGRLFQFAFYFSRSALHSVFCAVFHSLCSLWQSIAASNALFLRFTLLNRSSPRPRSGPIGWRQELIKSFVFVYGQLDSMPLYIMSQRVAFPLPCRR